MDSPSGPSRKVLLVDADVASALELGVALRAAGFETLEATTYEQGRRLWNLERPSALIADIRLGQFNGLQLLLHARSAQPDISVVITCAFTDKVLETETTRLGGTFLVKPVAIERVLAAIREGQNRRASTFGERRVAERRRVVVPGFRPDRRVADRRVNQ